MSRARMSTRAILHPSGPPAESGAAFAVSSAPDSAAVARAAVTASRAMPASAPRASALARRAQAITGQLGLPGERVPLDEVVERLLGLPGLLLLLLAQRQLVQGGRDAIPGRVVGSDQGVLRGGAVEHGLGVEALPDTVLRVVGEVAGGETLHEVSESAQRHRVPSLR